MAQILVRNLDEDVVKRLKARARKEGRSLQSKVRQILEEAADAPQLDMDAARKMVDRIRKKLKGRKFPDTVELIREGRNR